MLCFKEISNSNYNEFGLGWSLLNDSGDNDILDVKCRMHDGNARP